METRKSKTLDEFKTQIIRWIPKYWLCQLCKTYVKSAMVIAYSAV